MAFVALAFAPPASIEERADALLASLPLDKVIQQTWAPYGGTAEKMLEKIGKSGVGQLSFGIAGHGSIEERVNKRNELQLEIMRSSGIPASFSNEALHGAVAGGTCFSQELEPLSFCTRTA